MISSSKISTSSRKKRVRKQDANEDLVKEMKREKKYMEAESQKNGTETVETPKSDSETNDVQMQVDKKESTANENLKEKYSISDDDIDPINILLSISDNHNSPQVESFSTLNTQYEDEANIPMHIDNKDETLIEDKNILLSLIGEDYQKDCASELNPEHEIFLKKQELTNKLFSDLPSTSTMQVEKEESTDFLMSLID